MCTTDNENVGLSPMILLEQLKAVGFRESFDTPDPDVIEEEEEELDAEE